MSYDAETLLKLLPAIYRLRDEEQAAQGATTATGPLHSLLAVFAGELELMEESFAQLYDDLFIETCADWMVPYIGDLIGYEPLHPLGEGRDRARADVAHTIALRRRKGTAPVLEQLAQDGTGWPARAVEYFQRLATTQHLNHRRADGHQTPDLRRGDALSWIGTPFETARRTVDVRPIDPERGRHSISHVGLHLWRIAACPRTRTTASRLGPGRYRVSPLGQDVPLYQRPEREARINHLAEPRNVPLPMGRRYLRDHLASLYGEPTAGEPEAGASLQLWVNGTPVERTRIRICHLGDLAGGWGHTPRSDDTVAIDPVLGRIALPATVSDTEAAPAEVILSWHEGFTAAADLGGGEYRRDAPEEDPDGLPPLVRVPQSLDPAIPGHATVQEALQALDGHGIVEITDNATHRFDTLRLRVRAGGRLTIQAAQRRRPVLRLNRLELEGDGGSACRLDGLVIDGGPVVVEPDLAQPRPDGTSTNGLERLELRHCTLVPGLSLRPDGSPQDPGTPSLRVAAVALTHLELERCIVGAIRAPARTVLRARICLIDATDPSQVALMADDPGAGRPPGAGTSLSLEACTVVGRIFCSAVEQIANSVLLAVPGSDGAAPVRSVRRQQGCVRYSWIPPGSLLPATYRCQPAAAAPLPSRPVFTSLRYGNPAYGRLSRLTPELIRRGGEDEGEMGVFHHLWMPQREHNLRLRVAEYLRVGLAAGIFYES